MLKPLYDEEVEPLPVDADPTDVTLADVRRGYIALRQLQAEAEQIATLRRQVDAEYAARLRELEAREVEAKRVLLTVLQRGPYGRKLNLPDVGRMHVGRSGRRLRLKEAGGQEAAVGEYGYRFEVKATDIAAMNAWAQEYWQETGQVPTGYEVGGGNEHVVLTDA